MGSCHYCTVDELDLCDGLDTEANLMDDVRAAAPPPANTTGASWKGAPEVLAPLWETLAASATAASHGPSHPRHKGLRNSAPSLETLPTEVTLRSTLGCGDSATDIAANEASCTAGGVAAVEPSTMEEDKEPFWPADLLLDVDDLPPTREVNNLWDFDFNRVIDSMHNDTALTALVLAEENDPAFWGNFDGLDFDHGVGGSGEDSKGVNAANGGRCTSGSTQGADQLPAPPVIAPALTVEEAQ